MYGYPLLCMHSDRQCTLLPSADPSMATDMMKNMFMNVLPMLLLGGWISWTFSGFVISEY